MINTFVNVNDFGFAFGASFDMSKEGSVVEKRLTALEDCTILEPVYEKAVDADKVASYIAQGKKVENLGKAVITENKRVNALNALLRELNFVAELDSNEMVIAYVPTELLQELVSGRVKFYIAEGAPETTYYSETELNLWREAMPVMKELFDRLVFKDINACKKNVSNTAVQADRVTIYKNIYDIILKSYREVKANRANSNKERAPRVTAF